MANKTKNAKLTLKRVLRIKNVGNRFDNLRSFFPSVVNLDTRTLDEKISKVQRTVSEYKEIKNSKVFGLFSNLYGRDNAFRAVVCSKRSNRRRALFASGRAGAGKKIRTPRLHTEVSKVRC